MEIIDHSMKHLFISRLTTSPITCIKYGERAKKKKDKLGNIWRLII